MTTYPKIETLYDRNANFTVNTSAVRYDAFKLVNQWYVTEKVDGCLHYTQKVMTDQGDIEIGRIVNQKLPVKVASYNVETGIVEFRDIEYWHKEPRERPFITVEVSSRLKGNRSKFIVCTDNHKFFSSGTWVCASDLRPGQVIGHLGDILSEDARQIILGTLLGDGTIYRPSKTTRGFGFIHSIIQGDYFAFKAHLLGSLFHETSGSRGGFAGSQENRRGNSIVNASISDLIISTCESGDRKAITEQWLLGLTPMAIAIWYMDDGSCNFTDTQRPRAHIAANGFTLEEADRLCSLLRDRFAINCQVFDYKGATIVFNADGTERLFNLIFPYVPDCMKYKLPSRYAHTPCALTDISEQYRGLLDTKVLSVSDIRPVRAQGFDEWQYDLQVADNSNYFTNGILVHNTNVRITMLPDGNVHFGGRTDNAQMPVTLVNFLRETVTQEKMQEAFQRNSGEPWPTVTIFGEGYGEKIQNGGLYRKGVSLRIFDVLVDTWWLDLDDVADVASKLGLLTVPYLGTIGTLPKSLDDLHALVHQSEVAKAEGGPGCDAEGIVARTLPLLFMRNGDRLMWKLKARDFTAGKR